MSLVGSISSEVFLVFVLLVFYILIFVSTGIEPTVKLLPFWCVELFVGISETLFYVDASLVTWVTGAIHACGSCLTYVDSLMMVISSSMIFSPASSEEKSLLLLSEDRSISSDSPLSSMIASFATYSPGERKWFWFCPTIQERKEVVRIDQNDAENCN